MRCFRSAFRERSCTPERCRGIFNTSTGPCEGEGSDFFEAGSNATTSYSTCRPQLHADGVGTWLEPVSCEDSDLKPQGGATEQTVYAAVRQIGDIFNVAPVAEALVASIGIGPYTPLYSAGATLFLAGLRHFCTMFRRFVPRAGFWRQGGENSDI